MLTLRSLTKSFLRGTPNEVKAIDRIDLELAAGDFVTVIGSNGAGQTPLVKAIAGIAPPDQRRVQFQGPRTPPHPSLPHPPPHGPHPPHTPQRPLPPHP